MELKPRCSKCCPGRRPLVCVKVAFAGAVHGETLFVWAGYENQQQMIEQLAVFNDSESFANFNTRTQGFSSIVANEISTQLALWNGALYTE